MADYTCIKTISRDHTPVGAIELHRPEALNAPSLQLMVELVEAVEVHLIRILISVVSSFTAA